MKARHIVFLLVAGLVSSPSTPAVDETGKTASGVRYHGGDEVLLQGFHWNSIREKQNGWYAELKNRAPQIAADGFTAVWMPPPWRDSSSWKNDEKGTSGGGEGYFWKDFDKNGKYGSDADLRAAAATLNAAHVKPVYDIVPNHWDFTSKDSVLPIPVGMNRRRSDCPDLKNSSACDDGDPFDSGSADLDLKSDANIQMFLAELRTLHDTYGAGGFRFDFVRGYAPRHVDDFMKGSDDDGFCVGEWWKAPTDFPEGDRNRQRSWQDLLKEWSDGAKCTVFDFALKAAMQGGDPNEWQHGLNGNRVQSWREVAVTFVDNHDTGWSPGFLDGQHHWTLCPSPGVCSKLWMAYAFILTTPGTPTVYWPDMYAGDKPTVLHDYLRRLIEIRREAGIRAGSQVSFAAQPKGGLVVDVDGSRQRLLVTLKMSITDPRTLIDTGFVPALEADGGNVRVWHSGKVTPVPVTFRCRNGHTTPGRSVYVVGGSKELGLWKVENAVKLDPSGYPTWTGTVTMAPAFATDWKCVIRDEADNGKLAETTKWEPDPNNKVTPGVDVESEGSF